MEQHGAAVGAFPPKIPGPGGDPHPGHPQRRGLPLPLAEGYQIYSALRQRGVESRMVIFHGENHELSRSGKPLHRIRRLREITSWFQKHG